MRLLSLEGERQSKGEPGSFRPRIVGAWWVSDELKCCLWTVLDAWKSPLGSWWQHSRVVAAYSSKCRQCLTLSNILPTLTEGQMDPESFKNYLKESALGIEKKINYVLCVLPGWPEWCLRGFCCCCSSWSLQAGWFCSLLSFPFCLFGFSADEQKGLDSHLAQHSSDLSSRCQMLPEYKEIMEVTRNVSQL